MSTQPTVRIEYLPIDEVAQWPRNPRHHDDAAIERSLQRYGFVSPLLRDEESKRLVAGHGRLGALLTLKASGEPPPKRIQLDKKGNWLVPVICGVRFANAGEAESYLVADNRLAEIGGWDMDGLREIVRDLSTDGLELDALGWSAAALDALLEAPEPTKPQARITSSVTDDLESAKATRMVPIYLSTTEYQPTVDRMREVMADHKLPDYTSLLLFLLDHYESTAASRKTSGDPFNTD